jgi:hypothetical protein
MENVGGNEFFVSISYEPTLNGPWKITAQNGAETEEALTNDIVGIGPMPFVENLNSVGDLPTPTLSWTLPVTTEPFTRTRVRIYDATTNQLIDTFPVGLDTSFTVPAGLLDSSGSYNFRVMLENVSSDVLVNRSSTYIALPVGVIYGRVYQIDGVTPIGGATVEAALGVGPNTPFMNSTTTDAEGNYSLSLPLGKYRIRAKAPGYAREYYDNVTPSNLATLIQVTNGSSTNADFNLTEGGAIAGNIYNNDDLKPIANAGIFVSPALYWVDDGFHVKSSADGSYVVDGLALGQYKMQISADGFAMEFYEDGYFWNTAKNIDVLPPNTTSGIDTKLDKEATIAGRVLDSEGIPIQGVLVVADGHLGFGGGGTSNADGSYIIRGVRPDTYRLYVDHLPGWYAGEYYESKPSRNTADEISVATGDQITNIDFTLDEGGIIRGRVFDEASGQVIPNTAVFAHLSDGDMVTPIGSTNTSGDYRINLKPGTYYLRAWGEIVGYLDEWYQDATNLQSASPVVVKYHQETTGINLLLARPASISGRVFEEGSLYPISSANVFAFPVDPQINGSGANTQSDGDYKIEGLVTGDYVVQVTATGYAPDSTTVTCEKAPCVVAPNEISNIDLQLEPYPYNLKIVGQGIVGEQGGRVSVEDTTTALLKAAVDVPFGALSENRIINISEVEAPAFPPNLIGMGSPVHFGPEGLQFNAPVTLNIPYTQEDLDKAGITDPNQIDVYTFDTTTLAWEKLPGSKTVDANNRLIMIDVDHFSIFQLGISMEINCDINGNGRFDWRDKVRFAIGCRRGTATWVCDLNGDGRFSWRDTALYWKECGY